MSLTNCSFCVARYSLVVLLSANQPIACKEDKRKPKLKPTATVGKNEPILLFVAVLLID